MKKCCERFRRGECTNASCPFPHVAEATKIKPHEAKKANKIRNKVEDLAQKNTFIQKIFDLSSSQVAESTDDDYMVRNCKDCPNKFNLTEGEIKFYNSKEMHLPKRCKDCRQKRRRSIALP